jgi:hypothetical protein
MHLAPFRRVRRLSQCRPMFGTSLAFAPGGRGAGVGDATRAESLWAVGISLADHCHAGTTNTCPGAVRGILFVWSVLPARRQHAPNNPINPRQQLAINCLLSAWTYMRVPGVNTLAVAWTFGLNPIGPTRGDATRSD